MLLLADLERYTDAITKNAARLAALDSRYEDDSDECDFQMVGSSAVIQVVGPLSYKPSFWSWLCGGASYKQIQAQLLRAQASQDVKRIVMCFDTPGGEVTGCQATARMIANCTKPVDAAVDSDCASAGLWLASQCRSITCVESGEVGSLGVQACSTSMAKMLEMAGVEKTIFRSAISPFKNSGHPYEALTDEAKKEFQARVDKWGDLFLSDVAAGRKVSTSVALEKFGRGRMLFSDEALAAGLIDRIGSVESVFANSEPIKPQRTRAQVRY